VIERQKTYNTVSIHTKTKPGLVASYDIHSTKWDGKAKNSEASKKEKSKR